MALLATISIHGGFLLFLALTGNNSPDTMIRSIGTSQNGFLRKQSLRLLPRRCQSCNVNNRRF
jgi:hypothetical protein